MDIKELCKLCGKYSANKLSLNLEYDFKKRAAGSWDEDSEGMKRINSKIYNLENENEIIKLEIQEIGNVSFNWQ